MCFRWLARRRRSALAARFRWSAVSPARRPRPALSDDVAALLSDQAVALTFGTVWGDKTVSATLEAGDPRTLESAALRLNEALADAGYDLGLEAVALSGGGAGLRIVAGASSQHPRRFRGHARRRFQCRDARSRSIPKAAPMTR